jgi:hypothetical protein
MVNGNTLVKNVSGKWIRLVKVTRITVLRCKKGHIIVKKNEYCQAWEVDMIKYL